MFRVALMPRVFLLSRTQLHAGIHTLTVRGAAADHPPSESPAILSHLIPGVRAKNLRAPALQTLHGPSSPLRSS